MKRNRFSPQRGKTGPGEMEDFERAAEDGMYTAGSSSARDAARR